MTPVTIPSLPAVECPTCHHMVVLPYSGELVPFHWRRSPRPGGREPCPGQGARVVAGPGGLRAAVQASSSNPEETDVAGDSGPTEHHNIHRTADAGGGSRVASRHSGVGVGRLARVDEGSVL